METKVCLFCRVSSTHQDYNRQLSELRQYCLTRNYDITHTIATIVTGTRRNAKRADIKELFEAADKKLFTKVIVTEVSRIGRNAKEVWNTLRYLHERGISVVFQSIGGIESLDENGKETFISNVIIAIYSDLAQEEHNILSSRIKSGLEHARRQGKRIGRPVGKESEKVLLQKYRGLVKDLQAGVSTRKCGKIHGVSHTTVVKVRKACLS